MICCYFCRTMFGTCRIPKRKRDELVSYFKTKTEGTSPTHFVVLYRGYIYKIEMINPKTGKIVFRMNAKKILTMLYQKSLVYANHNCKLSGASRFFKPGLHESQLLVERSVTLVSSVIVERRRCTLQVCSVARLQENKTWFTRTTTAS